MEACKGESYELLSSCIMCVAIKLLLMLLLLLLLKLRLCFRDWLFTLLRQQKKLDGVAPYLFRKYVKQSCYKFQSYGIFNLSFAGLVYINISTWSFYYLEKA